jgi:hypothetical protein
MSTMDHAAAHERIEDLLLEPARLAALEGSQDARDVALREHVAGCATCRGDLEAWAQLQHRLAVALPGSVEDARAAVEPIEVPPSLRAGVIAAVREADRLPAPTSIVRAASPSRRRHAIARWLPIAAAFIVLVGAVTITVDQVGQRAAADAQATALSNAIAAVNRVLVAPDHWVVGLKDPAGAPGGSISWSSQDLVVLTTALAPPPDGLHYACWLVEDSGASKIGTMYFAGKTAYWVGSLDEWASFRIGPTTRFVVTLPQVGDTRLSGPIYLSADLGS